MNAPTRLFFYRILFANQLICKVNHYEYGRECGVCSTQNFLPDQNFQFSIFNFQLKISNFSYIAVHQMSAEIFIQKSLQW